MSKNPKLPSNVNKSYVLPKSVVLFLQVDHLLFVSEVGEKVSDVRMLPNSVLLIMIPDVTSSVLFILV